MAHETLLRRMRDLGYGGDADLWQVELDECHPADRRSILAEIRADLARMEAREVLA